jgi:hypothetical protein
MEKSYKMRMYKRRMYQQRFQIGLFMWAITCGIIAIGFVIFT